MSNKFKEWNENYKKAVALYQELTFRLARRTHEKAICDCKLEKDLSYLCKKLGIEETQLDELIELDHEAFQ